LTRPVIVKPIELFSQLILRLKGIYTILFSGGYYSFICNGLARYFIGWIDDVIEIKNESI